MPMPIPAGSNATVNAYGLHITAKRENQ
jgi:hypothetical protein